VSSSPARILILKPCCLGDLIFTTPLLAAIRRAYPNAHISWAVAESGLGVLATQPNLNHFFSTGARANPASRPASLLSLIQKMRAGGYDLLLVPDRSRWLSLAALLSGIKTRVGLDSAGRGFGYTLRVPVDPQMARHEAEIYLDLARALAIDPAGCWANAQPSPASQAQADALWQQHKMGLGPLVLVHPGGGINAGMYMTSKRWPPAHFANLAARCAAHLGSQTQIGVLGTPSDAEPVAALLALLAGQGLQHFHLAGGEPVALAVVAALAQRAALYLGNDNGVGHLAAAAGAKVAMIFGPSDPRRYAPFVPPSQAQALWRPIDLPTGGVAAGPPPNFSWDGDGITPAEAWPTVLQLLANTP
jgi:ADP-heptose:LPS heptosyltransferase